MVLTFRSVCFAAWRAMQHCSHRRECCVDCFGRAFGACMESPCFEPLAALLPFISPVHYKQKLCAAAANRQTISLTCPPPISTHCSPSLPCPSHPCGRISRRNTWKIPTGDGYAPRALAHPWAVRLAGATTLPKKACRPEVGAKVLCGEAARRIWPLPAGQSYKATSAHQGREMRVCMYKAKMTGVGQGSAMAIEVGMGLGACLTRIRSVCPSA